MPFRLGVVSYLNMVPLVAGLAERYPSAELQILHAPPSRLASWLSRGEIDMGMVPVASLFANPDWRVVLARPPEAGRHAWSLDELAALPAMDAVAASHAEPLGSMIGSRGGCVQSVLAIGDGPPGQWRSLRPDSHSMTSNALARIILSERYGVAPEAGPPLPADPQWQPASRPAEAEGLVLIGSRALTWQFRRRNAPESAANPAAFNSGHDGDPWTTLDLGAEWTAWTGLPFAYAVWATRPGVELGDWPLRIEARKRENMTQLKRLAAEWPLLHEEGMSAAEAEDYLRSSIDYDLDREALAGLLEFRRRWDPRGAPSPISG